MGQGLNIVLEDEIGTEEETIWDQGLLLPLILASRPEPPAPLRLIDFIDDLGLTLFNRLQMGQVYTELEGLREYTSTIHAVELIEQELVTSIQNLIKKAQAKMDHYVRVIGD